MKSTFIITGGNSGLGYQCAKYIAQESADNYIVIVSRNTDALDLAYPNKSNHTMRYSATKLCNLYCTYEMAARIKSETDKQISVNAFNPGLMADPGLSGNAKSFGERLAKRLAPVAARLLGTLGSAQQSGKLLASLMTDMQFIGISGKYFDRRKEIPSSQLSYNKANAENLWKRSIELVKSQNNETTLTV